MINVIYLLSVCLFLVSTCLNAVEVDLNTQVHGLYLDNGKETDYTYKVLQDKQGYLWGATDHGLKRYDGYQITQFIPEKDKQDSLGSMSNVEMIIHDDVLWLGGNTLSQYHPETENFTNYDISDFQAIWALYQDNNDVMWVGGEGFGLRGFDLKLKKVTKHYFKNPQERFIYDIAPDNKTSGLWISSSDGLFLFFPETGLIEQHLKPNEFHSKDNIIGELLVDNKGMIWIASREGLFIYNPFTQSKRHYRHNSKDINSLSSDKVTCLYLDSDNQIWVGTDKNGINIYGASIDGFYRLLPSANDSELNKKLPAVAISDIYQDSQKSYWIASAVGIRRLSPHLERFSYLKNSKNDNSSLSFNNVLGLHQARTGEIWIATDGGGLNKLSPSTGKITHYTHDENNTNSLRSDSVISIDEDNGGNLWLGTYGGGLNKFNPENGSFTHFLANVNTSKTASIGGNNIFKVFIDENQRVMLSIWQTGLQIYDPAEKKFISYFPGGLGSESGISNNSINDIEAAGDGSYWIGGYNGLERFYPDKHIFKNIPINGINDVLDILVDDNNLIWLATSQGLIKYNSDSNKVKRYTKNEGLPVEFIVSIEQDERGILWLGSRAGLIKFNPLKGTFSLLSMAEGLSSNEFNRGSHLYSNKGIMYFGGPNGINIFDPRHMTGNLNKPIVIITDLKIHMRTVQITKQGVLTKHISLTDSISLKYFQNDIVLTFSGLDFIAPEKNRYRYKLKGLENEWNEVSAQGREVRYTNLASGKYIFEVKASNNEGVWSENITSLTINISPPWWNTWWANVLFLIIGVLVVYCYIYWRLNEEKIRSTLLERKVGERTQELANAIKTLKLTQKQLVETEKMASLGGLVVGVAHEINTPLGNLLMAVSSTEQQCDDLFCALEEKRLSPKSYQGLKKDLKTGIALSLSSIKRVAKLVNSFKQVAVWRSQENSRIFRIEVLLKDCLSSLSSQLHNQNISVTICCPEKLEITSLPEAINEVMNHLILNSLLHGFSKLKQGEIYIDITVVTNESIELTYQDNGQGIENNGQDIEGDDLVHLFEPFFTTNRYGGSAGLGLHIVYNIVTQQLQGTITAQKLDQGIKFIINLPLTLTSE